MKNKKGKKILSDLTHNYNFERDPAHKIVDLLRIRQEMHITNFRKLVNTLFTTLMDKEDLVNIIEEERKEFLKQKGV